MPDPAGGGGVKPTQGQQIVANMFEGAAKKKLDQAEHAAKLQEQSQDQQSTREAGKQGQTQEAENQRSEKAEEGQAHEARLRGDGEVVVSKRDKAMDGFLSRGSDQAKTRDAGREMTRDKGVRQHGTQSWNVSTSRQTPPKAQRLILAKQVSQTFTPQGRTATPTLRGGIPGQTFSQMPSARTLTTTPFPIRYGTNTQESRGGETLPQRPMTQRFDTLRNLRQQIANLMVAKESAAMTQGKGEKPVIVHLRGNLVFVRENGKTRAFKLEKDGSLSELPTDDASDTPLSQEAKAQLKKVLRQHGIKSEVEGEAAELKGEISDAELAKLLAEQEAMEKGEGEPLDFETKFALLLYEALEEKKKMGKKLGEGEEPKFPSKKDWEAFFAKLGKLGNQEKEEKKSLDEILKFVFRGLFQKKGKGSYLVGDLQYQGKGKTKQDKFAQVEVTQEELLKFLRQLAPGQTISLKKLSEAFGSELTYLMMAHMGEAAFNMASSAERHIQFDPRASFDAFGQARFEQNLLSSSRKKPRGGASMDSDSSQGEPQANPSGVFANVYELLGLRRVYEGNPKLYTAIAFFGLSAALTLAILALVWGK